MGSCLVWACCFPRLVLFGLVPSPPPPPVEWGLWSFWLAPPRLWGAVCSTEIWYGCCRLLVVMSSLRALSPPPPVGWGLWSFWLAPPRLWGAVFYRGMVWLLPLVSSNVIVTCLVSSPRCRVGPVVVLVGPTQPVWGSVFYRDMVWLLPLVSSNVIVTCSLPYKNMMLRFSPCKRCPCLCSDAVLRSCEEALADHSPSSSLPLVWVGSFRLSDREGRGDTMGGGLGPGTREHTCVYVCGL